MLSSFKNDLQICVIGASGGIGRCLLKKLDNDQSVKSIYTFFPNARLIQVSDLKTPKVKNVKEVFRYDGDPSKIMEFRINANQELDLETFVSASEIIFTSTRGLTLFINANEIKQVSGHEFPIRLIIQPKPPSISIQRYKPLP